MNSEDKTAKHVIVEFDRSLLNHFAVSEWNTFVDDLLTRDLIPPAWSAGDRPPPMSVMLDFSKLQRRHYRLDGINLALCGLADADFEGASLKSAQIGYCPRASFRGSRLDGASFLSTISGCDFTGATGYETADWTDAVYEVDDPPVGLLQSIIQKCGIEEAPPPREPRQAENPTARLRYPQSPLSACVTIHASPIGVRVERPPE